jgi:hypothetical protein
MLGLGVRAVLVAALVVALVEGGTGGLVLGLVAILGAAAVVGRQALQSRLVFRRVRRQLQHARPLSLASVTEETGGWDPHAGDSVTGLWNGARVQITATRSGALIATRLDHWPAGLTADRRGEPGGATTGDETFDRLVLVVGDDVLWRPTLASEPRRHLAAICTHARANIRDQTLEIAVNDADIEMLEVVLDLAAALAADLPTPSGKPMARVFELAMAEPLSSVRAQHYRWLVGRGWNTPQVYRVAAEDADPAISAWGASQLPPTDGIFR